MTDHVRKLQLWTPRILGILVAAGGAVFALDALGEGATPFLVHLAPPLFLLIVVAASWSREWIGAVVFIQLALLYTLEAWRHPSWLLLVAGPLLTVGALFLWSWRHHDELHPQR